MKKYIRMGVIVLKISGWGGEVGGGGGDGRGQKSMVLWSQIAFYGFAITSP